MANQLQRSVWTRDSYFSKPNLQSKGDPTDTTSGIGQQYNPRINLQYPCTQTQFEGVGSDGSLEYETPDKFAKITTENICYKNMSQKDSNRKLMRDAFNQQTIERLNKNPMFSKPDDEEAKNRQKTVSTELKNPEFILSKVNDKKIEDDLQNTNSIRREWTVDTGMGVFDYDPEEGNQVKLVIDSNANYIDKRDQYFIQPVADGASERGASAAEKSFNLFERQEQEFQAMRASIPTRGKNTGTRRKF